MVYIKSMTRLTVWDVSKALQLDGPWLVQSLYHMGITNAEYVPRSVYVDHGYFECVIEPNPVAPGYGMLSVFVTPRGVVFIQYLLLIWMFMRYQHEYAIDPKTETHDASRLE
ncbi:MAG: hypothetical protein O3A77_04590 [bacterium]|nr:hypothetical protein [bacterium]